MAVIDYLKIFSTLHTMAIQWEERYFGPELIWHNRTARGGVNAVDTKAKKPKRCQFVWVPDPEMEVNVKMAREAAEQLAAAVQAAKPAEEK